MADIEKLLKWERVTLRHTEHIKQFFAEMRISPGIMQEWALTDEHGLLDIIMSGDGGRTWYRRPATEEEKEEFDHPTAEDGGDDNAGNGDAPPAGL